MTDNDAGNELGEVTLMTLHAAKGSEYQVIFYQDGKMVFSLHLEV